MAIYLPDANILIYCLNEAATGHPACRHWLEGLASQGESLALCELVEVAFLRITTLPALKIAPVEIALGFWSDLKSYPHTVRLVPGTRHASIFERLIEESALIGNDLNDAWLAAVAIESNAVLVSADEGFGRFKGLRWFNPLREIKKTQ